MTKTILSMCLAAAGFGSLLPATVSAHEAVTPVATQTTALSLPDTARVNATVVIERHGRRHNRYHSRYHSRHAYYRHGHRYYR